jgi:hypothetical protein
MLAFTARHTPKGINIIFAAGYGICEVLGAQVLFSTIWPYLSSTLKERLNASNKNTANHRQGVAVRESQDSHRNLP